MFKSAALAVMATVALSAPAMAAEAPYIHDAVKAQMSSIYNEGFSKGNMKAIDAVVHQNVVDHEMVMSNQKSGRDGLKQMISSLRTGFPDLKVEMLDFSYSKGKAFVRYRMTGTQKGAFMGKPASGKKIDFIGFDEVRFKDGLAVEHWGQGDNVTMMKQLGLMQAPPAAPAPKK
ncbi:MAG: hypothetical protein JWM80_5598 [Cyanobacteria bacterium RYN_339]|nr:hypothetical protein [Cyanobacteria bacterium RYN_339]